MFSEVGGMVMTDEPSQIPELSLVRFIFIKNEYRILITNLPATSVYIEEPYKHIK